MSTRQVNSSRGVRVVALAAMLIAAAAGFAAFSVAAELRDSGIGSGGRLCVAH